MALMILATVTITGILTIAWDSISPLEIPALVIAEVVTEAEEETKDP